MTSDHRNTSQPHTLTKDEQQKDLRCFLDESRARFTKLLQRWSWGEELFKSSSNDASQESVNKEKNNKNTKKALLNQEAAKNSEVPGKEKFLPSCATHNTLRMTAEETQELLGVPYPGDARNLEDLQVNYTPAQRLSLYTHLINKIPTAPEQKLNALYGITDYDELNASRICENGLPKRRYRVSRPTMNEELRELVELQMTALRKKNDSEQATSMRDSSAYKVNKSVLRKKVENAHKMAHIGQPTERGYDKKKPHHDLSHRSRRDYYKHHHHKHQSSYEGSRSPSESRQRRRRERHRSHKRSRSRSRSREHRHYSQKHSHSRNHSTTHYSNNRN